MRVDDDTPGSGTPDDPFTISPELRDKLIADGVSEAWISACCIVAELPAREQAALA